MRSVNAWCLFIYLLLTKTARIQPSTCVVVQLLCNWSVFVSRTSMKQCFYNGHRSGLKSSQKVNVKTMPEKWFERIKQTKMDSNQIHTHTKHTTWKRNGKTCKTRTYYRKEQTEKMSAHTTRWQMTSLEREKQRYTKPKILINAIMGRKRTELSHPYLKEKNEKNCANLFC